MSIQGQTAAPDTLLRDHASSAAYYRQEAEKAREAANNHWAMLLIYQGKDKGVDSGSSLSDASSQTMVPHCERVIESFRDAATSLEALAREHDKKAGSPVPAVFINRAGGP